MPIVWEHQRLPLSSVQPGYDGVLKVQGNQWVNGHGVPLLLRGVNNSGMEQYGLNQGGNPWDGHAPDWALLGQWGAWMAGTPNALISRIPLNSASFLGLTTYTPTNATTWGAQNNAGVGNGTADPLGNYHSTLQTAIAAMRQAKCYIVLDLHWVATQLTLGGVTRYASYVGQNGFMDVSNGLTFWTDPTVGIVAWLNATYGVGGWPDIALELFNEPFLGTGTYSAGSADLTLLNGGTGNTYITNGGGNISTTVTYTGYQACINGIRALGAENVIIFNGNGYASQMQHIATWAPTDPAVQLAAGQHPYSQQAYPEVNVYPGTGADTGSNTSSAMQWAQAWYSAGNPMAITEFGNAVAANGGTQAGTQGEPAMSYIISWARARGVPTMAWTFGDGDYWAAFNATSAQNQILRQNAGSTARIPVQGEGWVVYEYLSNQNPPAITSGTTLPAATQGSAYTGPALSYTAGTGVSTYSFVSATPNSGAWLSSGSVNASTGVITGTPGSAETESIVIQITDTEGLYSQQTFSLTVNASGGTGPGTPGALALLQIGGASNTNTSTLSIAWGAAAAGSFPINHYRIYRNATFLSTSTPIVLASVSTTGTAGQFSCTGPAAPLVIAQPVVVTGTLTGTGSISGYVSGNTYYISTTNGSTTFTLQGLGGAALVTSAGTMTGLSFTILTYTDTTATNCCQNNTVAPSTAYAYSVSAVDSQGTEGSQQSQCFAYWYRWGVDYQSEQNFSYGGLTLNWAATTGAGAPPPQGTQYISNLYGSAGGFQPTGDGPICPEFGMELGWAKYMVFDCNLGDATHTWNMLNLCRPGYGSGAGGADIQPFLNFAWCTNTTSPYGSPSTSGWATIKIPLTTMAIGVTVFNGYASGTTVTMVGTPISGPGGDSGGYITGSGMPAGTYISTAPGSLNGPFTINNNAGTIGSAGSPVQFTITRTALYKPNFYTNTGGSNLFLNNIGFSAN